MGVDQWWLSSASGPASDEVVTRQPLGGPVEYTIVAVACVVGVVMGGVWLTGQVAGLLFAGSWPQVSFGQCLEIAVRLPGTWSDPRRAWPSDARAQLPGALGFAAAALIVLATGALIVATAWRLWAGRRQVRGFASAAQIRSALSPPAALQQLERLRPGLATRARTSRGGGVGVAEVAVDLGRTDRRIHGRRVPVATSIENSVLLLAAPRQGKTSQIIIPWLYRWPGPAVVTSVRSDVVLNTMALRGTRGPVAVMDLTGGSWPRTLAWSPVNGCASFDTARQRADVMVSVGKGESGPADSTNAGFFGLTATNLLAGWLHAAALTDRSMHDVLRWALDERDDAAIRLLRDHPRAADGVAAMLDNIYRSPTETRSNMWTTVLTAVAPLLSPTARRAFCPPAGAGLDVEAFLTGAGTAYLLVPESEASDLAPLVTAFTDELVRATTRRAATTTEGRMDPPLGMFLDEVANVVPLPQLPALMSYAGGTGIFVTAVLQDIAQARARWGRDGADMLWGAATVKIALGGLGGDELSDFARLAGQYRETQVTHQSTPHGETIQTSLADRPVIAPEQVRRLSAERRQALIIHANTPPVITRMRRHYEGPDALAYARAVASVQQEHAKPGRNAATGCVETTPEGVSGADSGWAGDLPGSRRDER
jgi:type IV secretion system protein VirD4